MRYFYSLILLFFSTAGCAPVKQYEAVRQAKDVPLEARIGTVILHVDKTEDEQGLFGGAAVGGGVRDRGYLEIHYKGVGKSGKVQLEIIDLEIPADAPVRPEPVRTQTEIALKQKLPLGYVILEFTGATQNGVAYVVKENLFTGDGKEEAGTGK